MLRPAANGRTVGGIPFTTGPLAALLKNPVYIGKVAHGGKLHEGEHDGIIDEELWSEVQSALATNRREHRLGTRSRYPSLLTGTIIDPEGRSMSPTHATKGSKRHHYYISRPNPGEDRKSIWRMPAGEIDRAVIQCLVRQITAGEALTADDQEESESTTIPLLSVPEQRALLLSHRAKVSQDCNPQLQPSSGKTGTRDSAAFSLRLVSPQSSLGDGPIVGSLRKVLRS